MEDRMQNFAAFRGVIKALETTTLSDLRPVAEAVDALERKIYGGDYKGPDGPVPADRELQPLADALFLCLGRLGCAVPCLDRLSWWANRRYWQGCSNGSGQQLECPDLAGWESTEGVVKKVLSLIRGWVRQMNPAGRPVLESFTSGRISFDAATHTVTLDGEVFPGVEEVGYICLQAVVKAAPFPVALSKLPGLETKKIDRELDKLPPKLRGLIEGTRGKGSWLRLP
jgi:hypothetical protein